MSIKLLALPVTYVKYHNRTNSSLLLAVFVLHNIDCPTTITAIDTQLRQI